MVKVRFPTSVVYNLVSAEVVLVSFKITKRTMRPAGDYFRIFRWLFSNVRPSASTMVADCAVNPTVPSKKRKITRGDFIIN